MRLDIVGTFEFARVNSGAPSGRPGSRGFILERIAVVVDSLELSKRSPGAFGFVWVHSVAIGVVGFIRVRVGAFGRALRSSVSFGFAWVLSAAPRDRQVNPGLRSCGNSGRWVC